MEKTEHIEPVPLKAGDQRVKVNGFSPERDFRIIAEDEYQYLLSLIPNLKIRKLQP